MFKVSQTSQNSEIFETAQDHQKSLQTFLASKVNPISQKYHEKFLVNVPHQKKYRKNEGNHNDKNQNGRWTKEEHEKFISAIISYGSDWKKVQKYVTTRTSTQARSHAQKFLLKLKQCEFVKSKKLQLNDSWSKTIQFIKRKFNSEELNILLHSVQSKSGDGDFLKMANGDKAAFSISTEDDNSKSEKSNDLDSDFLSRKRKFSDNESMFKFNCNSSSNNIEDINDNDEIFNDNEYIQNFDNNFYNKNDLEFDNNDLYMLFTNQDNEDKENKNCYSNDEKFIFIDDDNAYDHLF